MLVALLLFQMVSMSLTSALLAAHPPVILAAFMVTAVPLLAVPPLGLPPLHSALRPPLGWSSPP